MKFIYYLDILLKKLYFTVLNPNKNDFGGFCIGMDGDKNLKNNFLWPN